LAILCATVNNGLDGRCGRRCSLRIFVGTAIPIDAGRDFPSAALG
jgi:hypothetical protein